MVVNPCAVTILIPAYNEAETLRLILAQLKELNPEAEILIVDDGSSDDTAQIGAQGGARVVRHPYNKGNGASIKTGLRLVRDADLRRNYGAAGRVQVREALNWDNVARKFVQVYERVRRG